MSGRLFGGGSSFAYDSKGWLVVAPRLTDHLFKVDPGTGVVAIDPSNGAQQPLTPGSVPLRPIAVDAADRVFVGNWDQSGGWVAELSPATGALDVLLTLDRFFIPTGIAIDGEDLMPGVEEYLGGGTALILRLDPDTRETQVVSSGGLLTDGVLNAVAVLPRPTPAPPALALIAVALSFTARLRVGSPGKGRA